MDCKRQCKEQIYKKQMIELGIYQEIFDPEIKTLARIERELTRAEKAWSRTAPPGGKPSFLDDHYPVIQKLRAELLQHREALGLTPKALRKLTGAGGTDSPEQKDLITAKLDQIAARVAGYDPGLTAAENVDWSKPPIRVQDISEDSYGQIELAAEASAISELMDEDLRRAVHEDMG